MVKKIADLTLGMSEVTIEGVISEKFEPRVVNTRYGRRSVADAILKDETGTIKLSLWEDKIDAVQVDDKVEIRGAYINQYRDELQLNIPRSGTLEVVGKG